MKSINNIGLEVETALDRNTYNELFNYDVVSDVKCDGSIYTEAEGCTAKEVVSIPLISLKEAKEFFDAIKKHYILRGINESMGFHIHYSFYNLSDYTILYSRDFVEKFIHALRHVYRNDSRLQSRIEHNRYATVEYNDEYFKKMKTNSRYKAVNFLPAYTRHGTYEVRIFPSCSVTRMFQYLKFTTNFIEKYLEKHRKKFLILEEDYKNDDSEVVVDVSGILLI